MFLELDSKASGEPRARHPCKERRSVRVLRMRVKDKHAGFLNQCAREVNLVFNFCNELGLKALEREGKWMSGFDYWPYLKGSTTGDCALSLPVQTVQEVAEEHARRRSQHKKRRLAWRKSGGARRSLGWVPFKVHTLELRHGQVRFAGFWFSLFDSYNLAGLAKGAIELRSGSFSEDSRGRWFLNVAVEMPELAGPALPHSGDIGIDLGLKEFAAVSDGLNVAAERFYRDLEPKLATAQRAGKKSQAKAIHAKITNRRKDFLHKLSTALVRKNQRIFVGNVNASALARTNGKSVLDAGWSTFRSMLLYKGADAEIMVREVNESFSTQSCSACGARTGPKGLGGLSVRQWTCGCGAQHDRDVNAARNILLTGLAGLVGVSGLAKNEVISAPGRQCEDVKVQSSGVARVSNKDSGGFVPMAGAGHGPLAEGIPTKLHRNLVGEDVKVKTLRKNPVANEPTAPATTTAPKRHKP